MDTITENCNELASHLGLVPDQSGLFVGRVQGFPVGLKFIDPGVGNLLLFQIRHWLMADSTRLKEISYAEDISILLKEKKIEIEFADRMAWLTIINLEGCLERGSVSELLNSVLESFKAASMIGDPNLCHYCQNVEVLEISVADEKVAQICPACMGERVAKRDREAGAPNQDAIPILLLTPFAALAGAFLWAGLWIGYSKVFERVSSGVIFVPRIVMAVVVVCFGLLVGGPVGWVIKKNRRRGKTVSAAAAITFGSLAIVAGEILFVAWLIYREFKMTSLASALHAMPVYYLTNDPYYIGIKVAAAIVCVIAAYEIAKPEKAGLKL